jgi:hypothetical protein
VQKEILEAQPEAALRVYAIYFEMVDGDEGARARVDPRELLDDPRVTSYWDERKVAGRWFDEHVTKLGSREGIEDRIEWDTYILYAGDVEWGPGSAPDRISWGRTLHGERMRLLGELGMALESGR